MNKSNWDIGKLNQGKPLSNSIKLKISSSIRKGYKLGRKVWNKGQSLPDEIKQKISKSKKGSKPWNIGIPRTLEERKNISLAKKGAIPWNRGRKWLDTEKKNISKGLKKSWDKRKKTI